MQYEGVRVPGLKSLPPFSKQSVEITRFRPVFYRIPMIFCLTERAKSVGFSGMSMELPFARVYPQA